MIRPAGCVVPMPTAARLQAPLVEQDASLAAAAKGGSPSWPSISSRRHEGIHGIASPAQAALKQSSTQLLGLPMALLPPLAPPTETAQFSEGAGMAAWFSEAAGTVWSWGLEMVPFPAVARAAVLSRSLPSREMDEKVEIFVVVAGQRGCPISRRIRRDWLARWVSAACADRCGTPLSHDREEVWGGDFFLAWTSLFSRGRHSSRACCWKRCCLREEQGFLFFFTQLGKSHGPDWWTGLRLAAGQSSWAIRFGFFWRGSTFLFWMGFSYVHVHDDNSISSLWLFTS